MSQPEQKTGTAQLKQKTNAMSSQEEAPLSLKKFQDLLRQLFQIEAADLDFGIYRIMNAKREEITRFLNDELLPQVRECLGLYERESRAVLQAELEKAKEQAKALGFEDPAQAPKVKEPQERYNAAFDIKEAENEVFSHLYNFFRRYYSEGDFISQRRYKEDYKKGPYAIPYHGEEVKLFWANYDQYYIKTSEYLRNYTFKLPSGKRVHFKLGEADTEKDNNRPQNGKERRFILSEKKPLAEENGELVIRFEYRPDPQKRKQADLNAEAVKRIGSMIINGSRRLRKDWLFLLKKPPTEKNLNPRLLKEHLTDYTARTTSDHFILNVNTAKRTYSMITNSPVLREDWLFLLKKLPTEKHPNRTPEKRPNRTLLEKHLTDYTARNTFDYFIHKDLGGFLRQELDFYIKNEVMHLDDIKNETAPRVEQYLSKIKAIRRIAHKIIDFLAQLENFQKKLWLKKKFVVETQYCVTLDRVPEELYPEIAANEEQRKEWVRLFAINELQGDLTKPGYSEPLTVEFLKSNPYLVLDTRHFSEDFKRRLLASFDDLDEQCDGLFIHSENFQALNLLMERYRGQVKCIYIDPPYNTGNDQFIYKDNYQHSSWLSMMADRLALMADFLRDDGALFVSIDENERDHLRILAEGVLGKECYLNTFVWINNLKGRQISGRGAARTHEYVLTFGRKGIGTFIAPVKKFKDIMPSAYKGFDYETKEDAVGSYVLKNELYNTNSKFNEETRPNLVFNIHYNFSTGEIRFSDVDKNIEFEGFVKIPPKKNNDGSHKYHAWRWGKEKIQRNKDDLEFIQTEEGVKIYTKVRGFETTTLKDILTDISTSEGGKELSHLFGDVAFPNYPKPVVLVEVFAGQAGDDVDLIADFFAGSGPTAHAVINLNREDGGRRKYILVEMGEYFDTVLVPRIKKVVYSKDWKDGKPVSREGISHMFKYIRLESYEDTLNNLELKRTEQQNKELSPDDPQKYSERKSFREDYILHYMLDVESRGSPSLLNLDRFDDPFSYKLNIATSTAGETKPTVIDLVETFNYLIGLRVKTIRYIDGVCVVTGTNPQGERVLILWRNTKKMDNDKLDEWFKTQGYDTKGQEFDLIYVNGDNNLGNFKRLAPTWKVRLIEEEFRVRMFDVQDV
jgi:adenine-specific DNA-methyltransferase